MKRVVLANDHAAVELASKLRAHLETRGFQVDWLGTKSADNPVDYPDMAAAACNAYLSGTYEFGVLCCGTGIGISIAANKISGIRCSLPQNLFAATASAKHNNPNFYAFGGRIEYQDDPVLMLDAFIDTPYEGGRHDARIEKITSLEHKCACQK